jgi:uncharacterized protein (DUF302 family)
MFWLILLILALLSGSPIPADAQDGRVTLVSRAPFGKVAEAMEQAVTAQKMALVCHANAQRGAAARGVTIKGNQVFMVFRNDFAVRLIAADPRAAYEAPIRIYLYENPDGTATVSYARPSALLAPYTHSDVRAVAAELDPIFKAIVDQALAAR